MGDIILACYGHDHKHKQFIQKWREFRERNPQARNTPELARIEFYNLRYDPQDKKLVKHEINYYTPPTANKFFWFKRNGKIGKIFCKIFSFFIEQRFQPYEPIKPKKGYKHTAEFGHFGVMPLFEKEDIYKWNNNEP